MHATAAVFLKEKDRLHFDPQDLFGSQWGWQSAGSGTVVLALAPE